jgi:hypothetical protein
MKKVAFLSLALISIMQICFCQEIPDTALYMGQTPPGDSAIVFAPGFISLPDRKEPCITFSPDGKSAFFYIEFWPNPGTPYTLFTEYKNGKWTTPASASFTKNRKTGEPFFAFNGSRIYLNATNAVKQVGSIDLSYVEKVDSVWSEPKSLGSPPNSTADQYHSCVVADSSIYFSASGGEICRCQYKNGAYQKRVILPYPINNANTTQAWGDPYVAPDESYLIFHSTRKGGFGGLDIYISYKKSDGTWTNPKNLGDKINTSVDEMSGDITPDGKYMTFGRNNDIYWVSTSFIEELKLTNFAPYLKSSIKAQTDTVGHSYLFQFADSAFIDDDGINTLTYTATLDDGTPLPSWLTFNPSKKTLSGIPSAVGTFKIKITATDTAKESASATFNLVIKETPASLNQYHKQQVSIFPNPSTGKFVITLDAKPNQLANIEIYNFLGNLVLSKTIQLKPSETIDLSGHPKGIYLVKSRLNGVFHNEKICIE